jgi:hypothetical protein
VKAELYKDTEDLKKKKNRKKRKPNRNPGN